VGVSLGSDYQNFFAGMTSAQQTTEINRMIATGITWVRLDVNWETVQPNADDACDFAVPMQTAGPMLAAGLNVLAILLWSPSWARLPGANPAVPADPFDTISPTTFAAFCGQAAAALGTAGVTAFEIWNEPNLDAPAVGSAGDPLGLGYLSPVGYAALAAAAYAEIHSSYQRKPGGGAPTPTVVGGVLAGSPRLDWNPNPRTAASWSAVSSGAATAAVTCTGTQSTDRYMLITGNELSLSGTDTPGLWPAGTYVSEVTSTGYVLSPPPWRTSFPAVSASTSSSTLGVTHGYPPDVFVTGMYAAAAAQAGAGQSPAPMFDAFSMHPYASPSPGSFTYIDSGAWAMVPEIRTLMTANGDGAKSIWFTELGLATGQNYASWPALAQGSAAALTISSSTAQAADVGCLVGAPGLPLGSYVAATTAGESWTVLPPTGLTVNQALTVGSVIDTLVVAASQYSIIAPTDGKSAPTYAELPAGSGGAVTIQPGTTLSVWLGNGNGYYAGTTLSTSPEVQVPAMVGTVMIPFSVTVTGSGGNNAAVTIEPGSTVTLDIGSVTVSAGGAYPNGYAFTAVGGAIQAAESLGQSWPTAVPSTGTNSSTGDPVQSVANIVAPGLLAPTSIGPLTYSTLPAYIWSEAEQAWLITYSYQQVLSGGWNYVGPMFVYCWSDASNYYSAGSFGLTRFDGSAKPGLAALSAIGNRAGIEPLFELEPCTVVRVS
jgi:hypothetical protein